MMTRSWLAFLLLINYLLVVGMGCVSRPEDQPEFLLVQTTEAGQHYQECRYMRMDGLENFLLESLASRCQNAPATPKHHLFSVVSGVDCHCMPLTQWPLSVAMHKPVIIPSVHHCSIYPSGTTRTASPPPRLG